jgi:uncharacterized lipoprotein YddW (UPF0748 family)
MHSLPLILLALLGSVQGIDDFRYADTAAARAAWLAGEGTPPVQLVTEADRSIVKVPAPFASQPKLRRAVADHPVSLDLSAAGRVLVEAAADDPDSMDSLCVYFRSGNGWYVGSCPFGAKGWQTLSIPKNAFQIEGKPAGWHKIDRMRLCVWRLSDAAAKDTAFRLRRIEAVRAPVAVVRPVRNKAVADTEYKSGREAVATLTKWLDELSVAYDVIDEDALAVEAVAPPRLVTVLPYNPALSDDQVETLAQRVEAGGKLLVCYALDPRLAEALGFANAHYVRPEQKGQFAEMRFDAADVPQLPKTVRQNSWNITVAEPAAYHARVIGHWYDESGQTTDQPAVLLSDRGVLVSHVLLPDDRPNKCRLVAALLGQLAPPLWQQMARAQLDRVGRVGHCQTADQLTDYFKHGGQSDRASVQRAEQTLQQAASRFAEGAYAESFAVAQAAHDALVDAYLRAAASPKREARALWNHSGTGAYPGDWPRTAKLLDQNGFNMIFPNMLWGGLAHYPSDVLPRSKVFEKYGDQIQQCCDAAKPHGLEVHVWKVNFNLCTAPPEFLEQMRRDRRTQVSVKGAPSDWLCPSHPENQTLERESLLEVARKYPVDGLHFDYIRYPDSEHCYCDGCRQRFEAQSGRPVVDWPKDCYSGPRKDEYNDWRCRQITELVATVSREAKKLRPGLKISAAVFGSYPDCRRSVAQDWPAWVKAGYLDFVCPMDYAANDRTFVHLVRSQMKLIAGRVPLYPGIGATATGIAMTPDQVIGQIYQARQLGAAGFTIFNLDANTAASIVPGVGLGAGTQAATPPHHTP